MTIEGEEKPRRGSLPKGWSPSDLTLEQAIKLIDLPRLVGLHPEDGEPIEAGIGRYGPFVRHGSTYANLANGEEVFEVGVNRAVDLIAQKKAGRGQRGGASAAPLKELGEHPSEGGPIQVMSGRYGPYVKHGKTNATLPRGMDPQAVTLEQAVELIAAKAGKTGGAKKAPAKRPQRRKPRPRRPQPKSLRRKGLPRRKPLPRPQPPRRMHLEPRPL